MNAVVPEKAALVTAEKRLITSQPLRGPRLHLVVEWVVALVVLLCSAALHLRFITNVGGLWRDEANSINLATLPNLRELWSFLDYDSFPLLYFLVLRSWAFIFGAGNDAALRVLGLLIGLGILVALWGNARALGARLPLLSLGLLGLNPMFVRYGDSNRAFGLGIILILLTQRAFWRLVEEPRAPTLRRIAVAGTCALLSVHCLYYNSVLLLAICLGALAIVIRAQAWRTALIILGLGSVSALSLLPYVPMMVRMQSWTFMVKYPCNVTWLWQQASEVMGSPFSITVWLWTGLCLVGIAFASYSALRNFAPSPAPILFATVSLVAAVVGYTCFLRLLSYRTQPWYYIALAAFVAGVLDPLFSFRFSVNPWRYFRPAVALVLLSLNAQAAWAEMPIRQTNLDLVAAQLNSLANRNDLVVMPRWECAISFRRYYHGPATLITLPPIDDHRFHRYDLVLAQIREADILQPSLNLIDSSLRSGGRVFLVGNLPLPPPGEKPPAAPALRADSDTTRLALTPRLWFLQTGWFLGLHTTHAERIPVPLPDDSEVQHFENLPLTLLSSRR